MLVEISLVAKRRESFGFETTLSGRSYRRLIGDLKRIGYEVHFYFLWIPTVQLALARVKERVLGGGHDVPEVVVRRRFERSIHNFLLEYCSLGDSWMLFDNSGATPTVVAFEKRGSLRIINREIYNSLILRYQRT